MWKKYSGRARKAAHFFAVFFADDVQPRSQKRHPKKVLQKRKRQEQNGEREQNFQRLLDEDEVIFSVRERVEVAGAQPPKAGDLLSFFGCAAFAENAVARQQIHFYDEIEAVFVVDGGVRGGNLPAEACAPIRAERVEAAVEFDVLRGFGQRGESAVFVGDEVDIRVVHIGIRALRQHRQKRAQQPQKRIFRRRGRGRQHKSRVFLAFLRLLKRMRFEKSVFESDLFPRKAQRKKVREAVEPVIELLAPRPKTPRPNPQQLPAQPRGHRARHFHFSPFRRFDGRFVEEVLEGFDGEILDFL